MAEQSNEQKTEEELNIWPISLLLHQAYATNFACIKCNGIPTLCMNNEDGEVLCDKCALNMDDVSPNNTIRRMINRMKTKCLSLTGDDAPNDTEGGDVIVTAAENVCDWTGMIQEWDDHYKQCAFVSIQCDECKTFKCQRQLMSVHVAECPQASIDCPLLCGSSILRKDAKPHLEKDCAEQLLDCSNDDCKMRVKRKDFPTHINQECDVRIVECEFVKYGCSVKQIKANQLKTHMDEYKFDHISNKFDFVTTQQAALISTLRKELNDVTTKITEMEEKKEESLWKHAVYSTADTKTLSNDETKCLMHMVLPQKAGKYVCKYSFIGHGTRANNWWMYYHFKFGNRELCNNYSCGLYLYKNNDFYNGVPLSGTAIVELNGNENEDQRKLALYHQSHSSYPSGMKHCCIECYELP